MDKFSGGLIVFQEEMLEAKGFALDEEVETECLHTGEFARIEMLNDGCDSLASGVELGFAAGEFFTGAGVVFQSGILLGSGDFDGVFLVPGDQGGFGDADLIGDALKGSALSAFFDECFDYFGCVHGFVFEVSLAERVGHRLSKVGEFLHGGKEGGGDWG